MSAPDFLVNLAAPWESAYSDSKLLETVVTFAHVGALLLGGGLAIAADRATLRAGRGEPGARAAHLAELAAVHRLVVSALALAIVSGVLLFLADVRTFYDSWLFWTKLALVALLLVNGYAMTRVEARVRATGEPEAPGIWLALTRRAKTSFFLWFVIAFIGVALVNVS